jgi:hypothetical protein
MPSRAVELFFITNGTLGPGSTSLRMGGEASEGLACASLERGGTGPARRMFIPLFLPWLKPNQGRKSRISQSVAFTPQSFCSAKLSEKPSIYQHGRSKCAATAGHFLASARPGTASRPRPHSGRRKSDVRAKAAGLPARAARKGGPRGVRPVVGRARSRPAELFKIYISPVHEYIALRMRAGSFLQRSRHVDCNPASCRPCLGPRFPSFASRIRPDSKINRREDRPPNARLPIRGGQGISRGRDRRFAVAVETWPRG